MTATAFNDTATQEDDVLTPPSTNTNDNSAQPKENPASDNNSDNNGKGGDVAAVVETSEPDCCEPQDTADRIIEIEQRIRDGDYTEGELEHLKELLDREKYQLKQEEAEMYAENQFTINRFSDEPKTKTPLEELIDEYNATIDAAKKLSHVTGDIYNLITQRDQSYYYPTADYEKRLGKEYFQHAINWHYWNKIFKYAFLSDNVNRKIYNLYQSTMLKLKTVEFNKENICNALNTFKAEAETELLADIVECFGNVLKDDSRLQQWRKDIEKEKEKGNDIVAVRVEKKIICSGDSPSRIENVIRLFDNKPAEKEYAPIMEIIYSAKKENNLRKVDTKYFKVDIFKDNRYHLTFKNLSLLRMFNVYVNKKVGRLPEYYGIKNYIHLTSWECCLVNVIENKARWEDCRDSYEELRKNYNTYNVNPFETFWNNFINSNKCIAEVFAVNDSYCL